MRKYKLFNIIPVFDIVIVLLIACVAFVGYKVFTGSNTAETIKESEQKIIRYTIEFENVSAEVNSTLEVGQKVRDLITNVEMGTIVSYESYPFVQSEMNMQTGEVVLNTYQDRKCVKVVVEAVAEISKRATTINNVNIGLGRVYKFSIPSIAGDAIIRNIEEVDI